MKRLYRERPTLPVQQDPADNTKEATSWRPLTTPESKEFFRKYDVVIATDVMGQGGRGNTYEVYTYGQIVAERPSLAAAKSYVEEVYGAVQWRRVTMDPVEATHYYFGPSTEWSDPLTIYVVDKLPRL
jgi:hypothetical protein